MSVDALSCLTSALVSGPMTEVFFLAVTSLGANTSRTHTLCGLLYNAPYKQYHINDNTPHLAINFTLS